MSLTRLLENRARKENLPIGFIGQGVLMGTDAQDVVCAFVREIIEARIGEPVRVTDRPEQDHRSVKVVEERWESASRRYAVEHTRLESYGGQIGNAARLSRLIVPVREMLAGCVVGTYVLVVSFRETKEACIKYVDAHKEIVRLTLEAAPKLDDGETIILPSERLPFRDATLPGGDLDPGPGRTWTRTC